MTGKAAQYIPLLAFVMVWIGSLVTIEWLFHPPAWVYAITVPITFALAVLALLWALDEVTD